MPKKPKRMHKHLEIDEKILAPKDEQGTGFVSHKGSRITHSNIPTREELQKSVVGLPRIYDLKGNLLADETNLVVLVGREFLAQKLAERQGDNPNNYRTYHVKYFGVGDGGTTSDCPPETKGPYDNDTDLNHRVKIKDPTVGSGAADYNYIDGGKLKRIEQRDQDGNVIEGEITIVSEEHTINTENQGEQVVHYYTAVRYTMYINPDEVDRTNGAFRFNEAGLYAVNYENGRPVSPSEYILFARFTTLDKYLETNDGIVIEWYILV